MHWAACGGSLDVTQILISYHANPNCIDFKGTTPLHEAASGGFDDIISFLIDSGASVIIKDNEGVSILHKAAIGGHFNACHVLLTFGADVNSLDWARVRQIVVLMFFFLREILHWISAC